MLDLFSGIGGFSLAAQWVWGDDLEIIGFCEIEKYAQRVLQKNFPGVPIYEDITKLDGKDFKDVDLITGGFPCQDLSSAGKGAGIEGSRSSLWFEMWRIIGEVRPKYALIENVPMLVIRGGTRVIADLAEIGYDASWDVVSASDEGAWHKRARIWIVAYPNCDGTKRNESKNGAWRRSEQSSEDVPDAESEGYKRNGGELGQETRISSGKRGKSPKKFENRNIKNGKAEISDSTSIGLYPEKDKQIVEGEGSSELQPVESRSYRSDQWTVEPNVGRVAHGVPNRVDRLKGLGNAIVPQVAYGIMKLIKEMK